MILITYLLTYLLTLIQYLYIRSLLNPLKYTAIYDLIESHHIDLFAMTETWIISSSSSAELAPGFMRCPRPTTNHPLKLIYLPHLRAY